MRTSIVAIAIALAGAASPASADPRIMTVQEQAQTQERAQAPDQAPAQTQDQAPAQGQDQAPAAVPAPAPAQTQNQAEGQGTTQAQPTGPARDSARRQDSATASVPGRYSFQRVDDGFLRFDNKSGRIAFCSPRTVGWACQAVPEDRAALEKEIARLQGEVAGLQDKVAGLKKEIAALREPPPPPRPPAELAPRFDKDGGLKLPSDEDIARARAAIENAWRRLMDMITDFQKDMMRKVQSDRTTL